MIYDGIVELLNGTFFVAVKYQDGVERYTVSSLDEATTTYLSGHKWLNHVVPTQAPMFKEQGTVGTNIVPKGTLLLS